MDLGEMILFVGLESGLLVALPCLVWMTARLLKLGRFRADTDSDSASMSP